MGFDNFQSLPKNWIALKGVFGGLFIDNQEIMLYHLFTQLRTLILAKSHTMGELMFQTGATVSFH